jgi:hypothetical protein
LLRLANFMAGLWSGSVKFSTEIITG